MIVIYIEGREITRLKYREPKLTKVYEGLKKKGVLCGLTGLPIPNATFKIV